MIDSFDDFTPEKTYSLALGIMRRLTRGRSIGIRDVCDMANDVAWRVIQRLRTERIVDLNRYVWGVARHVLFEALRAERKHPSFQPLCDVPELPESGELPPILDDYIERFLSRISGKRARLLDDTLFPNGRKQKEIAAQHRMSESAFSKTLSRINTTAHSFHTEFVNPLFEKMSLEPSEDLDEAILTVARSPQERADYQLRLIFVWQVQALVSHNRQRESLKNISISRSKLISLVARCSREPDDIGFRNATRWAIAHQYMLEGRPSDASSCVLDGIAEASAAGARELALNSAAQFTYPCMFVPSESHFPYPTPDPPELKFLEPVAFALQPERIDWTTSDFAACHEKIVDAYGCGTAPGFRPLKLT